MPLINERAREIFKLGFLTYLCPTPPPKLVRLLYRGPLAAIALAFQNNSWTKLCHEMGWDPG